MGRTYRSRVLGGCNVDLDLEFKRLTIPNKDYSSLKCETMSNVDAVCYRNEMLYRVSKI